MRMTGRAWILGAVVGLAWAGQAAADEEVRGLNVERTIDCDGGRVTISGTSHRLTLRGNCERVILSGTSSVVHIESLGRLTVSGLGHRVEWEQGIDGATPSITKSGVNNEVVQVKGGAASSSRTTTNRRGGSATVETGPGGVVVDSGTGRVTVGAEGGVTVDSGSGKKKDRVTVKTDGSGNVVVSDEDGTVKVGGGNVVVAGSEGTVKVGGGSVTTTSKPGSTLTVDQNGQERTYDCAGGTAVIQGNNNVLTLRACPELIVNGNKNTLTLQTSVRVIRALGNGNQITYSQGTPDVESLGTGNNIKKSGR